MQPVYEARSISAQTMAPAAAIQPIFTAPTIHSGSGGAGDWSDRRLKRDIAQLGISPSGLPIYAFQ